MTLISRSTHQITFSMYFIALLDEGLSGSLSESQLIHSFRGS